MHLFKENIRNWRDWGNVYQSIAAFAPLVEHIFAKEGLSAAKIENLTPGTNAVFRAGNLVVKIFAPEESGIDQTLDLQTELFATARANRLGVSAPKLAAHGFVQDKYRFAYMITDFIEGEEFSEAVKAMSDAEKTAVGRRLRSVTDKMNTPCESFNDIDVINDRGRYMRWEKYPDSFKAERLVYIRGANFGEKVFAHGDLCGDNILITPSGELVIIDFADAVLAPTVYEHALIAVELFEFDPALLRGFFGDYSADELTETCFNGLLIHDFGGDIVKAHIAPPGEMRCLDDLRRGIKGCLLHGVSPQTPQGDASP